MHFIRVHGGYFKDPESVFWFLIVFFPPKRVNLYNVSRAPHISLTYLPKRDVKEDRNVSPVCGAESKVKYFHFKIKGVLF